MNRLIFLSGQAVILLAAFASLAQSAPSAAPPRFLFRDPQPRTYLPEPPDPRRLASTADANANWVKARLEGGPAGYVELGNRVVLQLQSSVDVGDLLKGGPLKLARTVAPNVFILQATNAPSAIREAQRLAQLPGVLVSHPVQRRSQIRKHGPYAAKPNDTHFAEQWNLENRDTSGNPIGPDLNVRAAWPFTRGQGTVLAIADDGVELTHPEFARHATNGLHFNFGTGTTNAMPVDVGDNHSTAVAGLALAQANNRRGMAGMAPEAQLASWKIFRGDSLSASDEQMMDMFQFQSNIVSVQNHSWGNANAPQLGPTALESIGISNALAFGRAGRGTVMVRSGGNGRADSINANDDGYASDPRVIAVASVREDGRAASYSNPGACLLVAAPGGDSDRSIFTTDRQGSAGFNVGVYTDDFADYVSSPDVVGTSFAAPLVSGLAALILSANPDLTYRDVQQILILSSRHFDLRDPDLRVNGAGFLVSHNVGYGVPDAGQAVSLARLWQNRPALTTVTSVSNVQQSIPDDGLRVVLTGTNVPSALLSIPASPSLGPHADAPTATLPLVDVGLADAPITIDLTGKAALIQRDGTVLFSNKIQRVADAGGAFAIIYNNVNGTERFVMGGTDYVPIPAVMIDQNSGESLRSYLQNNTNTDARARIQLTAAEYSFSITNTLLCEHVGVRVRINHTRRGDLRITLLSPQGTRSVLQHANLDDTPGPSDWTYYSTHHFYESSAGTWTVSISDQAPFNSGSVQSVELIVRGVAIADSDADGLDDDWETAYFGSLRFGPRDDPDGDGYSTAREQIMGTNPTSSDAPFTLDFSPWDAKLARLSWRGVTNRTYDVLSCSYAAGPLTLITNLPGRFPETEWFTPYTNLANQFFRVRTVSP